MSNTTRDIQSLANELLANSPNAAIVTIFDELLGHTLTSVERVSNDEIIFTREDGKRFRMFHEEGGGELVTIEDINGELSDLVGATILQAECVQNKQETIDDIDATYTWTFYKFATIKGYVTIRWYGESNGYYSETVDFEEIE